VLRALEDLRYEAVDNAPLDILEDLILRSQRRCAIGVDARSRGFDADALVATQQRLRSNPALRAELVYVWADEATLLRRYTESRRRHPLAPQGRVSDGIAEEMTLTAPLRDIADLIVDTSDLPLFALRRLIDRHFGGDHGSDETRMVVSLISFSYAHGLPREADLVFDARFLRNPYYVTTLRGQTGLDSGVGAYIDDDPDFPEFFDRLIGMMGLLLPRFVQEGKKYATIAIGCTGGRHRSVYTIEKLAAALASRIGSGDAASGWRLHVTHRELAREGNAAAFLAERPVLPGRPAAAQSGALDDGRDCDGLGRDGLGRDALGRDDQGRDDQGQGDGDMPAPVQAQEA
jgi:UPF0042 nucleotide-binding protein